MTTNMNSSVFAKRLLLNNPSSMSNIRAGQNHDESRASLYQNQTGRPQEYPSSDIRIKKMFKSPYLACIKEKRP